MQLHNEDRLILECLSKLNHGPWFMVRVATYLVTHWEITWKISWIDSLFLSSSNIVESTQFTFLFALGSMDQLMRFEFSRCMRSETTFITNELFILFTCYKMIWKMQIIWHSKWELVPMWKVKMSEGQRYSLNSFPKVDGPSKSL